MMIGRLRVFSSVVLAASFGADRCFFDYHEIASIPSGRQNSRLCLSGKSELYRACLGASTLAHCTPIGLRRVGAARASPYVPFPSERSERTFAPARRPSGTAAC